MELTNAEKLTSFLIAPQTAPRPPLSSLPSSKSLLTLVEEHNLPLDEVITVNRLTDDALVNSECMKRVLELDQERHRRIRDEFVAFQQRLDEAQIPYVLLKAVHGVPYRSSNIDILIPKCDFSRADKILIELGYLYNPFRPAHYKYLYDRISGSRLSGMFHVHECVSWYSPFIEPELIFSTAVDGKEAGVRMPRTEVALAIIGCHAMYEDACVKFIDLHKVLCLLKHGPVDWIWLWKFARNRGFASGLALFFLIVEQQHRTYMGRPLFDDAALSAVDCRTKPIKPIYNFEIFCSTLSICSAQALPPYEHFNQNSHRYAYSPRRNQTGNSSIPSTTNAHGCLRTGWMRQNNTG
jgi:hypothetical protein